MKSSPVPAASHADARSADEREHSLATTGASTTRDRPASPDRREAPARPGLDAVAGMLDASAQSRALGRLAGVVAASQRVAAQRQLVTTLASAGTAPVQRIIKRGDMTYPTTWLGMARAGLPADDVSAAEAIRARAAGELGVAADDAKLMTVWNKSAKSTTRTYELDGDADALVGELVASYGRSVRATLNSQQRGGEAEALTTGLQADDSDLEFRPSVRNPMLVSSGIEDVGYDADIEPERRFQTHAATVVLAEYPAGIEAQGSMRRDGGELVLSTNRNADNDALRSRIASAAALKQMAAELLARSGIDALTREEAMEDAVLRHAGKLYLRIHEYLASDAPVTVPASVDPQIDGLHAEIRIEQLDDWDADDHFAPSGTKYPCMGCFLYLMGQKIEIGHCHGPMWVTNAALATQLLALLRSGKTIGKLGKSAVAEVAGRLATARKTHGGTMVRGIGRSGDASFDRQADSDSDLDSDEYADLQQRVAARIAGAPSSPQRWNGPGGDKRLHSGSSDEDDSAEESEALDEDDAFESDSGEESGEVEAPLRKKLKVEAAASATAPVPGRIDRFNVNGTTYAANDRRIRATGECLWDTLRHYGFRDGDLATAAADRAVQLNVDQHVMDDRVWPLVQALNRITGSRHGLVLDRYFIDGSTLVQDVNPGDTMLHIGLMTDDAGQAHYMPPWSD